MQISDLEKLEFIHVTLQEHFTLAGSDLNMLDISLSFVEELREPYMEYKDES
jgi:hypothetical protein